VDGEPREQRCKRGRRRERVRQAHSPRHRTPVEHAFVATDGRADTVERVRNALAVAGVVAEVKSGSERDSDETRQIRQVVRLIDLGTLLVL